MTNTNKPAYPLNITVSPSGDIYHSGEIVKGGEGLTKLEYTAIAAMQGFLGDSSYDPREHVAIAKLAVKNAQALLDELEKVK